MFSQRPSFKVVNPVRPEMDFSPVLLTLQSVRSSTSSKRQQSPRIFKLVSVTKAQDSILRHERSPQDVATAVIATLVRSRQQVISSIFNPLQPPTSADIPSLVNPLHLLKLHSLRDLQFFPIEFRPDLEISQPSNRINCRLSYLSKLASREFVRGMQ